MKRSLLLFLLAFCPSLEAAENFCDGKTPHPIDVWFDKAMEKTEGVTVNIRNVQGEAYSRWDKELNRVYNELMDRLNDNDKNRLREAQRAWVKFRDTEFELLWADGLYGHIGGTLAPIVVSDVGRGIVRARVCTLMKYLEMVKASGN